MKHPGENGHAETQRFRVAPAYQKERVKHHHLPFSVRRAGLLLVLLLLCLAACASTAPAQVPPRATPSPTPGGFVPTVMALPPATAGERAPTPTAAPLHLAPVGVAGSWTLLFHDEFSGHTLDTRKWTTCFFNFRVGAQDCAHDQAELELYQPGNVSEAHGILSLTARRQTVRIGGKTYHYTSGMISSGPATDGGRDRFAFRYGLLEMRARVPAGTGLWPGWWTLAADESYPPEIDVCEILGNAPTAVHMHYHWPDGSGEGRDEGATWTGPDFAAGWHTYAVDWEPGSLTWYVDGHIRFRTTSHVTATPMYLLATLAVGGDWPGNPGTQTPFPATFQIDFIRVWHRWERSAS